MGALNPTEVTVMVSVLFLIPWAPGAASTSYKLIKTKGGCDGDGLEPILTEKECADAAKQLVDESKHRTCLLWCSLGHLPMLNMI